MVNNSKILAGTKSLGLVAFVRQRLGKSRLKLNLTAPEIKGCST